MPNFPTNAVSTDNVDERTDSIRSARADIKSCVDNINSFIDCFDIQSPQSGEVLVAQSDGTFANQTIDTGGAREYFVLSNTAPYVIYDPNNRVDYNTGTGVADFKGQALNLWKVKDNSVVYFTASSFTVTDTALYYIRNDIS